MIDRRTWAGPALFQGEQEARPDGKKVLIVSENFGSGHTKAAEALAKGIRRSNPGVEVRVVELGCELRPRVSGVLLYSYLSMLKQAPSLWKIIYGRHHSRAFPTWTQWCLYRTLYPRLSDYIREEQPDLVISTHPFSTSGIARLKRKGNPITLCTLITDFSAHGSWVQPEVDRYLVPHVGVNEQLAQMGVEPGKIYATGIPTDSRFWMEQTREAARHKLGLGQLPTLLILGGGMGMGQTDRLVKVAAKWKDSMQILVCTGHNRPLKENLERDPELQHPRIRIEGFTDQMPDLMDAADLIVSKPGGMTCSEAIAKGKPLLIYGSIPGHEERNGRFMEEQGLAEVVANDDELTVWFEKLLAGDPCFDQLRERMLEWRQNIHPSHSIEAVLNLLAP
ncbi:glycosyltransferase [Kroppenstedtia eburnea]|uniref:MGDG synthase family glycosyltransferase n=1 Tax=Kroppenstedtia eburnea TaxID=714067 RepID=UPI00020C8833|nr:1,2-diacylglycerol 3-glucosyltransferase [Desmospora sp. 8437]